MTGDLRGAPAAQVEAQAKVNLRLRVLAREEGGYHQLETLFLRLDLADTVRLRRTAGARTLDVQGLPPAASLGAPDRNLAWRAAESYLRAAEMAGGFAIELDKRIPVGGGMGGGSADAGAVLRLLDAIAPRPLGTEALLALAAPLGADVPFMALEEPFALAWGRGERMLPLPPPPARDVLLVVSPFAVNTAEAYRWVAAARSAGAAGAGTFRLDAEACRTWEGLAELAANDFEPVVAGRHAAVAGAVEWLLSLGCAPAMMSGSGSVVFGVLPEGARAADTAHTWSAAPGVAVATSTARRVEPVEPLD